MAKLRYYFKDALWNNNQVLVSVLGICSALAITGKLIPTIIMAVAVTCVTALSCLFVSLLRNFTPNSVRMITQLIIVSLFVITVDQLLQAFCYEISKTLSVFVSLIITNCLVMGRCESMARRSLPAVAFVDGLGAGLGYGIVIILVALIRESLGVGTLLGYTVIPALFYATAEHSSRYVNFGLMVLPPAAFFIIGFFICFINYTKG